MKKPKQKATKHYDYFELKDYLIQAKKITQDEADDFWSWWCDSGGPHNNEMTHVPLGFWGWTDDNTQLPPDSDDDKDLTAHKVLVAFGEFANKYGELRVLVSW
jgi:hypothetical protein